MFVYTHLHKLKRTNKCKNRTSATSIHTSSSFLCGGAGSLIQQRSAAKWTQLSLISLNFKGNSPLISQLIIHKMKLHCSWWVHLQRTTLNLFSSLCFLLFLFHLFVGGFFFFFIPISFGVGNPESWVDASFHMKLCLLKCMENPFYLFIFLNHTM